MTRRGGPVASRRVSLHPAPAPWWVRAAAVVVPHLPAARYRVVSQLRRLGRYPFLMRLPSDLGGGLFHCDLRDATAAEVCFTGRYEPQETQMMRDLLDPGDVFVDVGANWGYYSLGAASVVGVEGRVVAFEPDPRLFAVLETNVRVNGLPHVTVQPVGIGSRRERVRFSSFNPGSGNWGLSRVVDHGPPDVAAFESNSLPLDEALDAEGIGRVRLVKIDVEGSETAVLAGMRRGLASGRYCYVMLECHPALLADRGLHERECVAALLDAGYRLWLIDQSRGMYRRAARTRVPRGELLRPYCAGERMGEWPHIVAAAPGAGDLSDEKRKRGGQWHE
jgi:FkbM family methyltransferase